MFIPTKTVSVKPTLESSCWREAVVIGDLDGYTPPSDPDIPGIFVVRHLPRYNAMNSIFSLSDNIAGYVIIIIWKAV